MAAQSPSPATQDKDMNGAVVNDAAETLSFEVPQPIREDQVQNAVKFLSHPGVRGSSVVHRRSFLQNKSLTKDEIDEAFRRVPDQHPPAGNSTVAATGPNQASQGNASITAVQAPQSIVGPAAAAPLLMQKVPSRILWYHVLLAAGLFAGCAASAAVFFQRVLTPKLRSWIRKVVAEGDETENISNSKLVAETAEAAKTAAVASAAFAKTSQELLAAKNEEMKFFEDLKRALDFQVKEMRSMGDFIRQLERRKEPSYFQEEHSYYAPRNGPVMNSLKAPQTYAYGPPNVDYGRTETRSTSQGVDRGFGSKVSQYSPAYPQPQYSPEPPAYLPQPQLTDDGSSLEFQGGNYGHPYQLNGKAHDASTGSDEKPVQKRWVRPQPPAVVMPEAAAAIRQPKSIPRQQSGDERPVTSVDNGEDGVPRASASVDDAEKASTSLDVNYGEIQDVQSETIVV